MKRLIERTLAAYLPPSGREPAALHKAMRYSVMAGGKRIRPIIVIEACKACGGALEDALPAACAIEFVHTYSLIHDDLPSMDDDDTRRGKPSCHKAFGEAIAILAGDALLTLAFGALGRVRRPEIAARSASELADAIGSCGMVGGQALDIKLSSIKADIKKTGRINDLKTAKLFEASARLGAIAFGAGAKKVKAAARFGFLFGRAFQMADDIADGEGYAAATGAMRARRDLASVIKEAKKSLSPFGGMADALKKIADSLV